MPRAAPRAKFMVYSHSDGPQLEELRPWIYNYNLHKIVNFLIRKYKGIIKINKFTTNVFLTVDIPNENFEKLKIELKEKSKGTILLKN